MMSFATYNRAGGEGTPILTGKVQGGHISINLTPNLPQELTEGGLKTATLFVSPAVSAIASGQTQTQNSKPRIQSAPASGTSTPTSGPSSITYYNIPSQRRHSRPCSREQSLGTPPHTPDTEPTGPNLYHTVSSPTSAPQTIILRRTPSSSSDFQTGNSSRVETFVVNSPVGTPVLSSSLSSSLASSHIGSLASSHAGSLVSSRSNSISAGDYVPPQVNEISLEEFMSFFTQIAQITDHLFLCAAAGVTPTNVKQNGVTNIINLTVDVPALQRNVCETTRVSIDDVPGANLGLYFDQLTDRIRQVKERGGRTLVHCVAGVSRSASICIAYLMKYYRMPLLDAFRYVKGRRQVIRPNAGFFKQLIDYERRLFGTNTVRMIDSSMGLIPDVYRDEVRGMVAFHPKGPGGPRVRRTIFR